MSKKRRRGCVVTMLLCAILLVYALAELYRSNHSLAVTEIRFSSPRLPAGFDGATIAHLSDLHAKQFGRDGQHLYKTLEGLAPDYIAVTGDFIDSVNGLPYLREACEAFAAIAPVYYVTGNHEWGVEWLENRAGRASFMDKLRGVLADTGVVFLDSQSILLTRGGDYITLTGICDPNGPAAAPGVREMYARMCDAYGEEPFSLALYHRNDFLQDFPGVSFDLVLAGHAHGGVIRLPFAGGLIGPDRTYFSPYTGGLYSQNGVSLIVSRGIGDTSVPRFWNRPEIVLITLRRENE